MYPVIRLLSETLKHRGKPLDLFGTHVSDHICWPWDLDPWMELNNGRTLTLFDLGRMPLSVRLGMVRALKDNGWGMTAAGNTVRYRRRVRMFHRVQMHSRLIGWDARFVYVEQAMWRRGEALNHILVRLAATDSRGILSPARLIGAMGHPDAESPDLPDWVQAWIKAEAMRPWPPAPGSEDTSRTLI
jgi:acyl-CoA thioesterase FadM